MRTLDERYIVDADGNRVGVVRGITAYHKSLEELLEIGVLP